MLRLIVRQCCAFGRESVILKPGTYRVDKLTERALRKSQPDLVRQKLVEFLPDDEEDKHPGMTR